MPRLGRFPAISISSAAKPRCAECSPNWTLISRSISARRSLTRGSMGSFRRGQSNVKVRPRLCQRVMTETHAASDLLHLVRPFRNFVLKLDRPLERVLLPLHQLQHFFDRRIALAPHRVRPVIELAVLQVDV